jgi:hypothetical protein
MDHNKRLQVLDSKPVQERHNKVLALAARSRVVASAVHNRALASGLGSRQELEPGSK